jgi:DNA modification methylase
MKLKDIKPNPNNPRVLRDDKFQKLKQSIKEFPKMLSLRPMVIDENNVVLGGNMRLRALQELGFTDVEEAWVKRSSDLTEEEKKRFIIADNVAFGEWDWDTLANDWEVVDLEAWGLEIPQFDNEAEELEASEDDYDVPERGIETDIVIGDLFEIGEHRLLCGDSTDSDAVARLMNGEKAEILFTSPPYSDMREYNGGKDLSVNNLVEFITSFYQYCEYQVINLGIQRKENEINTYWDEYIEKAKDNGYKFLSWNIWNRENSGFSMAQITAMFAIQHEWIFVFGKNRKELNLTVPNKDANEFNNHIGNRQKDGSVKKGKSKNIRSHRQLGTVNTINVEQSREWTKFHPAMFPVNLPEQYIIAMTNQSNVITDPFLGSGSTMVAAHQLKRRCFGMELEPKYCAVIIDRMAKLDPSLKITRNGKEYKKTV